MRPLAIVLAVGALSVCAPTGSRAAGPPAVREGASHAVPLYGALLRVFDAPDDPYAAGHRGVDVGAPAGTAVHVSADGTVTHAGVVAGNRSVSVGHGDGLVTTYSFLATAEVAAGAPVERGQVVGTVGAGHPGSGMPPHVHLSARRHGAYVDPLTLYAGSDVSDLVALVA